MEPDVLIILLVLLDWLHCLPAEHTIFDFLLLTHEKSKKEQTMRQKAYAFRTQHVSFFVTFSNANWLDGNHVVFRELVEGDDVLAKNEESGSRDWHTKEHITIEDSESA